MSATKADIIAQLQRDILPLQGFKKIANGTALDFGLGPIKDAFPHSIFPLGAVHEFICNSTEDTSSTGGFISGVLATLMQNRGVCLWINSATIIFPPVFKFFGIEPDRIIFVDLQKEKEILWTMEESLKCDGLSAVVGELQELSFITSRRLQLAVEQSCVTGFIIRRNPRYITTTACTTRWRITSLPSFLLDDMPGVGFPEWNVELLKVRNGKPGKWKMRWMNGKFHFDRKFVSMNQEWERKVG